MKDPRGAVESDHFATVAFVKEEPGTFPVDAYFTLRTVAIAARPQRWRLRALNWFSRRARRGHLVGAFDAEIERETGRPLRFAYEADELGRYRERDPR